MPGEPTQAPYPVAHPTFPAPGPARGTLELPTQMAVTLMLVWLTTLVAAFLIGRFSAPTGPELAPAPVAANGKPQDPETPSNRRQGDAIFVLKAIPRFTDVQKAAWQKEVVTWRLTLGLSPMDSQDSARQRDSAMVEWASRYPPLMAWATSARSSRVNCPGPVLSMT